MKKVIYVLGLFRNFFYQLGFVVILTALLCVLFKETNNMLKAEALAVACVLVFFVNTRLVFPDEVLSEMQLALRWAIVFGSSILLSLFTYWVTDDFSDGSVVYSNIGLMVGMLFTIPVCIAIGLLKEFDVLKPIERV